MFDVDRDDRLVVVDADAGELRVVDLLADAATRAAVDDDEDAPRFTIVGGRDRAYVPSPLGGSCTSSPPTRTCASPAPSRSEVRRRTLRTWVPGPGEPVTAPAQDETVHVVVTMNVLADSVDTAFGDLIEVQAVMPRGVDPHSFELSAAAVERLGEADLIVVNGLNLEENVLPVVDAAADDGIPVLEIAPLVDPIPSATSGSMRPRRRWTRTCGPTCRGWSRCPTWSSMHSVDRIPLTTRRGCRDRPADAARQRGTHRGGLTR